jgi:hypothetical protein
MNGSWKRTGAATALCLGLAAAATVGIAQERAAPAGPPGAGQHPRPDRTKMFEEMRARHEKTLHDLLEIKPDQEAAFHAYLASIQREPGKDGWRGRDHASGAMPAPLTTPERLDKMQARMAERQAMFQKTAAATKTFYAVLSPEQKRAFDAMPAMMRGHHGGRMGGHGGFGPQA